MSRGYSIVVIFSKHQHLASFKMNRLKKNIGKQFQLQKPQKNKNTSE
jgi:hypothetical protein